MTEQVSLAAPETTALTGSETNGSETNGSETEREAILLECCDLPDKQITLTESDLDGIVARFAGDVPIKVEHVDSALDPLGQVTRLWRRGRQLLGTVRFPADIARFLRVRGVVKLSCGLNRAPGNQDWSLTEVSLVLKPRLAAATLLSQEELSDAEQAELSRLREEVIAQRVDAQILGWKRAGKIIPTTEPFARALLAARPDARVTLSDGAAPPVADVFAAFLAAQPAAVQFGEQATAGTAPETAFSPEEQEFLSQTLGVDPARVAETLNADAQNAHFQNTDKKAAHAF